MSLRFALSKLLYQIKYMKLTQKAINAIRNNKRVRARLQLDLNRSEYTINRYIDDNDIMLTTAQALTVIREETGLSDDQILEKEPAVA
jgi:hypothetical protein